METDDVAKPLSELLEPGSTLMVATPTGSTPGTQLESRPLTVARVEGSRIEILLDTDEESRTGGRFGTSLDDESDSVKVVDFGYGGSEGARDPAIN